MAEYEIIEHMSDIGVRIRAKSLKGLFVNAAMAMFDLIARKKESGNKVKIRRKNVYLKDVSIDELLVRWLNELLSLSDCDGIIFAKFNISYLMGNEIKALVIGTSKENFDLIREIKAVTYHQLKVQQQEDHYVAEIIFDL